jgi:hypothetical protein
MDICLCRSSPTYASIGSSANHLINAQVTLYRGLLNAPWLHQLSLFLFAFLRLTILGFHGGFPGHLAIPNTAYRPPWRRKKTVGLAF